MPKTLILTPNKRMATFLKDAMPLSVWLDQLYITMGTQIALPKRLTSQEERVVWEQIVRSSKIGQSLLKVSPTARLALDAWILVHQWRLQNAESLSHTADHSAYIEWATEYEMLCSRNQWVDSVTFMDVLIEHIPRASKILPVSVQVVGFEEYTPQLLECFAALRAVGCEVSTRVSAERSGEVCCVAMSDSDEELGGAIAMASTLLKSNPKAHIGVVIPDLEQRRDRVVALLKEQLPQGSFNVSAPVPLIEYPFIRSIFLLFQLCKPAVTLEKLSCFLRSPFFRGGQEEDVLYARFDVCLRRLGVAEFSPKGLGHVFESLFAREADFQASEGLVKLSEFFKEVGVAWQKQAATQWVEWFKTCLLNRGWPGDQALNSEELQVQERWELLLEEYIAMEGILGEHHFFEAVSQVEALAREITFLPGTVQASVHVLGVLEAAGLTFDHLWVMGLHREAWPVAPKPNPFIPFALQRSQNVPRSSAERELTVAQKLTHRFSHSARQVVFSYPLQVDETSVVKSCLLEKFEEVEWSTLGWSLRQPNIEKLYQVESVDYDFRERAPNVVENTTVSGGSRVLTLQSICPFRAFAEIRLKARPMPETKLGLSPIERGEMIHQVLDLFWLGFPDQKALLALDEEEIARRIRLAMQKVFSQWSHKRTTQLGSEYLHLEQERIFRLLIQFIALEKNRPAFTVASQEKQQHISFADLHFTIRLDRCDRLSEGGLILLDYKTGQVSIRDWFGERPRDLQLPFYCVTQEEMPIGIVFGVLHPKQVSFRGIADIENSWVGMKKIPQAHSLGCAESWEAQCAVWTKILVGLAEEFKGGESRVSPLEGEKTCRLCSLKTLCRIHSVTSL